MKPSVYLILLFLFFSYSIKGQSYTSDSYLPVKIKGKYGYITPDGKIVIKPQFDRAERFSEGLAEINIGINIHGFGGLYGYIDSTGVTVIQPQYYNAQSFSHGWALVLVARENRTFIDKDGNSIGKNFYSATNFNLGRSSVKFSPSSKYQLMDTNGNLLSDSLYDYVPYFINGFASIYENGKCGVINTKGEIIISPAFAIIGTYSEGLFKVRTDVVNGNKIYQSEGYIDTLGNFIIPAIYKINSTKDFSDGLAAVSPTGMKGIGGVDTKWGYINKKGEFVIEPIYSRAADFHEGLAAVQMEGKYGFIDTTGKMVIKPTWDRVGFFRNGIAQVFYEEKDTDQNGRFGYINKKGEYIWKPTK